LKGLSFNEGEVKVIKKGITYAVVEVSQVAQYSPSQVAQLS